MALAGLYSWKARDNYCKDYDKFRSFLSEDKLEEEMKMMGTTTGLCRYINESLGDWKTKKIKIAVAGITGSGKSSLINALRDMKPSDVGAAKVGVTETTDERKEYTHTKNEHVALWDLPGLDSPKFRKETYIQEQEISNYDVVIVVSAGRFHDNDIWLAKECLQRKMNVLFARTKIDIDIQNNKRDHPDTSEEQCLQKIKKDIDEKLRKGNVCNCDVFLVSSCERTSYDFGSLDAKLGKMINIRGEAIHALLNLRLTTAIKEKRDFYKTEFGVNKFFAAVAGFLPLPNLETVAGNMLLYDVTKTCLDKFCLNEDSLDTFCKEVKISKDEIKGQLQIYKIPEKEKQTQYESTEDDNYSTFERYSKYLLPGIGSLMSAYKGFKITDDHVEKICDMFANDELKLIEIRLKKLEDELRVL